MMYPQEYDKYLPIANQVIDDMEEQHGSGNIYMDTDMLNQMVEEAVRRTQNTNIDMNMSMDMDMDMMAMDDIEDGDAVPTILDFGRRPAVVDSYSGSSTLSDIFKILLLQELFGRRYFYGPGFYQHVRHLPGHPPFRGGGRHHRRR